MQIAITTIGAVSDAAIEDMMPLVGSTLHAEVAATAGIEMPPSAFSRSRGQYSSTALLDLLARRKQPGWDRLLGIVDVDLYVPELNFVFGEADARQGVAVFSLARLHTSDRDRFVHRAATEAIHELGHTFKLTHCDNPQCVMWFSNTLAETDRKGTEFCAAHARALERDVDTKT
jgi:archaemetzincin